MTLHESKPSSYPVFPGPADATPEPAPFPFPGFQDFPPAGDPTATLPQSSPQPPRTFPLPPEYYETTDPAPTPPQYQPGAPLPPAYYEATGQPDPRHTQPPSADPQQRRTFSLPPDYYETTDPTAHPTTTPSPPPSPPTLPPEYYEPAPRPTETPTQPVPDTTPQQGPTAFALPLDYYDPTAQPSPTARHSQGATPLPPEYYDATGQADPRNTEGAAQTGPGFSLPLDYYDTTDPTGQPGPTARHSQGATPLPPEYYDATGQADPRNGEGAAQTGPGFSLPLDYYETTDTAGQHGPAARHGQGATPLPPEYYDATGQADPRNGESAGQPDSGVATGSEVAAQQPGGAGVSLPPEYYEGVGQADPGVAEGVGAESPRGAGAFSLPSEYYGAAGQADAGGVEGAGQADSGVVADGAVRQEGGTGLSPLGEYHEGVGRAGDGEAAGAGVLSAGFFEAVERAGRGVGAAASDGGAAEPGEVAGAQGLEGLLGVGERRGRVGRVFYEQVEVGPLRWRDGGGEDCFDRLARVVAPEVWGVPGRDETWLLREYVELTFERLHALRFVAVAADGSRCLFDTGLTTAEDAAVYGLCLPAGDADGPPWALQGWIAEGDARLADRFAAPPGRAVYTADPADLVYDWRHPLAVNPRALLESPESAAALPAELRANPYLAGLVMEGAVRRAEARVRRDPRAAVPAWDPAAERVRLLLPLSLSSPESVDVALVVAREDSAYRGVGILALDVARARARVVSGLSAWITA